MPRLPRDADELPSTLLRMLAVAADIGRPLHEAVNAYRGSFFLPAGLHPDLQRLSRALEAGQSLDQAIVRAPALFGPWVGPLASWGQMSGRMGEALEDAAELASTHARIRRVMQAAFVYPVAMLVVMAFLMGTGYIAHRQMLAILRILPAEELARRWPLLSAYTDVFIEGPGGNLAMLAVVVLAVLGFLAAVVPGVRSSAALNRWAPRLVPGGAAVLAAMRQGIAARLLAGALGSGAELARALRHAAAAAGGELERPLCIAASRIERGDPLPRALGPPAGRAGPFLFDLAAALTAGDRAPGRLRELSDRLLTQASALLEGLPQRIVPIYTLAAGLFVAAVPAGHLWLVNAMADVAAAVLER